MKIRPALIKDAKTIFELIKEHAGNGVLLPRPLMDIFEKIQRFHVCEANGKVIGCGALHFEDETLAEIRSLVVSKASQKKGIGKKIVCALEKRAKDLGVEKTFALSFKPEFFKKLGYKVTAKDNFPHKIWRDCVKCPLFPDCGETALVKKLRN